MTTKAHSSIQLLEGGQSSPQMNTADSVDALTCQFGKKGFLLRRIGCMLCQPHTHQGVGSRGQLSNANANFTFAARGFDRIEYQCRQKSAEGLGATAPELTFVR